MRHTFKLDGAAKYAGVSRGTILDWIEDSLLVARWDPRRGWVIARIDLDLTLGEVGRFAA